MKGNYKSFELGYNKAVLDITKQIKSAFALLIYDFDKESDIRKIEKREKELLKSLGEKQ